jgi:hypothetical protein
MEEDTKFKVGDKVVLKEQFKSIGKSAESDRFFQVIEGYNNDLLNLNDGEERLAFDSSFTIIGFQNCLGMNYPDVLLHFRELEGWGSFDSDIFELYNPIPKEIMFNGHLYILKGGQNG